MIASTERRARPGELCTCGNQARRVFISEKGEVGSCDVDGALPVLPCPFCGCEEEHQYLGGPGKCDEYRVRPWERQLEDLRYALVATAVIQIKAALVTAIHVTGELECTPLHLLSGVIDELGLDPDMAAEIADLRAAVRTPDELEGCVGRGESSS